MLPSGDTLDFAWLSSLPSTIAGHGITLTGADVNTALGYTAANDADLANYQPLDGDLTAVAALATTGVVKRTGTNTWTAGALVAADIPSLDTAKTTSGTFANARISQSSVTQHQAALAIDWSQLTGTAPALLVTDVYTVASQVAQLALTAQEGDIAIRTDLNKSYAHNGGSAGTMADWSELLTPTDAVLSFNGRTGAITLTSGDVTTALGYTPVNLAGDTMTGDLLVAKANAIIGIGVSGTRNGGLANYGAAGVGHIGVFSETAGGTIRIRPDGRSSGTAEAVFTTAGLTMAHATLTTASIGGGPIYAWNAANTDIDGLIPGTAGGTISEGSVNGHYVIGLRSNDASDGLYIIDKGNAAAPTTDPYVNLVLAVSRNLFAYAGGAASFNAQLTANTFVAAASVFSSSTNTNIFATGSAGAIYWRPNGSGSATGQIVLNSSGHLLFDGSDDVRLYNPTTDGADTARLALSPAGAISNTRGAYLLLYGNEHASVPGQAILVSGTGMDVRIIAGSGGVVSLESSGGGIATFNGDELWHEGNLTPANYLTTATAASTYVPLTRTVTAGNGLASGGALSSNITISLGAPSSLSPTSTNSLTSGSHTHAVSFDVGAIALADPIGSYPTTVPVIGTTTGTVYTTLTVNVSSNRAFQLLAPPNGGTTPPELYVRSSHTTVGGGGWTSQARVWHDLNLLTTTVGTNILKLANPGAITFLRMNADNTVSARSAGNIRTDMGIGTGDSPLFTAVSDAAGNLRRIPPTLRNSTTAFTAADIGKVIYKNNTTAYTWTLYSGTAGDSIMVKNFGSSGNITIARGGFALHDGTGASADFTLLPGQSRLLVCESPGVWWVE